MAEIEIDISVESAGWTDEAALEALTARAVTAAADFLETEAGQPFPDPAAELSLVFTSDQDMRALNADWRKQDKPTNVLSFPAFPMTPGAMPGPMLGDIVLARETILRESRENGTTFEAHLIHLIVHGFLHLIGYDHIEVPEAALMEGLETRILAVLGLSDPYGDSDPA